MLYTNIWVFFLGRMGILCGLGRDDDDCDDDNDKNLCRIEGARLFRCLAVDSEKIEEPVSNLLSPEVYFSSSTEGIPLKERGSHDGGP
jgi:hypothetical protein